MKCFQGTVADGRVAGLAAGGGLQGGRKGIMLPGRGRKGNGSVKRLSQAIMEHAEGLPEDALIRAGDLLYLGSRAAVNRALARAGCGDCGLVGRV